MVIDACLVDANVLLRMPRPSDPNHAAVDNALSKLAIQGTILHYTQQNIAEFWNTITGLSQGTALASPFKTLAERWR